MYESFSQYRDLAMGWTTGVQFPVKKVKGIFLFVSLCRPALGPNQPPIEMGTGIKRPEREADHSHPCIAEIKNAWSCTFITQTCIHSVVLN
jgi:hypothetical protein